MSETLFTWPAGTNDDVHVTDVLNVRGSDDDEDDDRDEEEEEDDDEEDEGDGYSE
jgi:hypothetical protein